MCPIKMKKKYKTIWNAINDLAIRQIEMEKQIKTLSIFFNIENKLGKIKGE